MSRGEATEGPLGSGTTQGIGHGSSRNRAPRFHGVASAGWPCLPTQPQFALHPFWEVDLMTASQRPQQLFSPSTAPSLVLASMSQAWVKSLFQGSGWCYGFPTALTVHPSPPLSRLQAPQEVEAVDAVLPSTYQRTAVQGPSPTVGKLWVEMAAGQGAGHNAQILEDPRGALGSRGMNSAALSPASGLENSSYE